MIFHSTTDYFRTANAQWRFLLLSVDDPSAFIRVSGSKVDLTAIDPASRTVANVADMAAAVRFIVIFVFIYLCCAVN